MSQINIAIVALALCVAPADANANHLQPDEDGNAAAVPPASSLLERERLSGDWWGHRTSLEKAGLTIGGEYIAEFMDIVDGGIRERGSFRNLLTLDAELDLETIFGLSGATVFVQYLSANADNRGSADAGDFQVFSNIENDRSLDIISELWFE